MLSRLKKNRFAAQLSQRSEMYLLSNEPKNKQYKILSIVCLISLIVILLLYKIGLFSAKDKTQYLVGSPTQVLEERTNSILSAWGSAGEALKFANLPSTAQGYLTVKAMVVQKDKSSVKQNIEIFYREASKLNPVGWGIADKLMYSHNLIVNSIKTGMKVMDKVKKATDGVNVKSMRKADENMDAFVIDKDITLILLHGNDHVSATWDELGTLSYFADLGYKVYSIDMPGFGHSQKVTVNTNEWLIDVIGKLLSSQDEEGNVDPDGGERHTDMMKRNIAKHKIHKVCIISPDISGKYTLDLVKNHKEKFGETQGLLLEKFIPISMRETVDSNDNEVKICNIMGSDDVDVGDTTSWNNIQNAQSVEIAYAGKHVYVDQTNVFHGIIANFLATDKCEMGNTSNDNEYTLG